MAFVITAIKDSRLEVFHFKLKLISSFTLANSIQAQKRWTTHEVYRRHRLRNQGDIILFDLGQSVYGFLIY